LYTPKGYVKELEIGNEVPAATAIGCLDLCEANDQCLAVEATPAAGSTFNC